MRSHREESERQWNMFQAELLLWEDFHKPAEDKMQLRALLDAYQRYRSDPLCDHALCLGIGSRPLVELIEAVKSLVATENKFKVGQIAKPLFPKQLHSGSGIYDHAICVSVEPFVLVSNLADMLWNKHHPADFIPGEMADPVTVRRGLSRLQFDQ